MSTIEQKQAHYQDWCQTQACWKAHGLTTDDKCEDCEATLTLENISLSSCGWLCESCEHERRAFDHLGGDDSEDFHADYGIGPSDPYESWSD